MSHPRKIISALLIVLALAACDTAEERAERHFRSAEALLEAGDVDRALVELRNVFKFDGAHREARRRYAELQLARGALEDGYGNLLRLVEFHPDDLDARLTLAELALADRSWEEAERHGRAAAELAPEALRVRAVVAALDYRLALRSGAAARLDAVTAEARAVLEDMPGAIAARVVTIDRLMATGALEAALEDLALALDRAPGRRDLHELRLQLLVRTGAEAEVGAQLAAMHRQFPADRVLREALVAWHVERGQGAEAEALLQAMAAAAPDDPWPKLALVEVVRSLRGAAAARAEIDRMIAAGGDALQLGRARAELARAEGDRAGAIAELEVLVAAASAGPARDDAEVRLAQLLEEAGETAAARARVGAVLARDAGHAEALKLEAGWLIAADRPGEAVLALRRALDQAPGDAAIMLLMAEAHLRDGSRELAGERLALAVELSGRGVRESLRYAGFLTEQGRAGPAEAVLEDARRVHPGDLRLVAALGELWVARGDVERAGRAVAQLRAAGTPAARRTADALEAALLVRQDRQAELLAFLDALVAEGGADPAAVGMILQSHLAEGDGAAAAAYLDRLITAAPGDRTLRFLRAGLHVLAGEAAEAEALYRALIAEAPGAEAPVVALHLLLEGAGRGTEAAALLSEALAARPDSVRLRWLLASGHEAAGDPEAAIAVYDALYAEDSGNAVFANNLASLLSTARSDADSLERAFAIARRLRGTDVPAFRDTYGWIEHRRGNHAEALSHLAFAAEAMPQSAWVQFHLGMTLAALDRAEEARAALDRALALGGLPAAQEGLARDALIRLDPAVRPGQ